jgi:hypothetical protein
MGLHDREWGRKGATLSDKTARQQYGLTQEEIYAAIDAGKLQYRPAAMHGNPWLRLLRREVEDLARTLHGERYLREQQARTELARINRELNSCMLSSPPSGNGGPRSFPSSASKARHGNDPARPGRDTGFSSPRTIPTRDTRLPAAATRGAAASPSCTPCVQGHPPRRAGPSGQAACPPRCPRDIRTTHTARR